MSDYTPTTEEVEKLYTAVYPGTGRAERDFHYGTPDRKAEFRRWLSAEHLRRVEAEGELFLTYYRSYRLDDARLWCESRDPAEVLRMSKPNKNFRFMVAKTYRVNTPWTDWDGKVPE